MRRKNIPSIILIVLGVVVILSLVAFFLVPKVETVQVVSQSIVETKEFLPKRGPRPCPQHGQRPLASGEKLYCR